MIIHFSREYENPFCNFYLHMSTGKGLIHSFIIQTLRMTENSFLLI